MPTMQAEHAFTGPGTAGFLVPPHFFIPLKQQLRGIFTHDAVVMHTGKGAGNCYLITSQTTSIQTV